MPTVTYRLTGAAYTAARRNSLITGTLVLAAIVIFSVINFFREQNDGATALYIPLIFGLMLAVFGGMQTVRLLKKQKAAIESYSLMVSDDLITAATVMGEVSLTRLEVREIKLTADGSISIRGGLDNRSILVPRYIADKQQLEAQLRTFVQIQKSSPLTLSGKHGTAIMFAYIACFFVFLLSTNRWVNIVAGPLVVAGMVWFFNVLRKQANLSPILVRFKWILALLIVVFSYKCIAYSFQIDWVYFPIHNNK